MGDDEACGTNLPRTHALTQKRESVFCLDSLLLSCRLVRQSLVCAFLLSSGLLCVCVSGGRSARNTLLPSLILSSAYSVTPLTNTECDLSSDPSSFWSGSRLWIVWFLHQLPAAFIYVTIRKDCTGVFFFFYLREGACELGLTVINSENSSEPYKLQFWIKTDSCLCSENGGRCIKLTAE